MSRGLRYESNLSVIEEVSIVSTTSTRIEDACSDKEQDAESQVSIINYCEEKFHMKSQKIGIQYNRSICSQLYLL